ncbi:MAG: NDP-sugar synthase [Methanomassiliicoccales archaeon]
MKAVILAGGLGTRMRPLTGQMPKPLVPLLGKPLVLHLIEALPQSVDTVILAVSYMKDALEDYFAVHECGRKVILVNETTPLGTGGALRNVSQHLDDTFLAFNGDLISSLDIGAMVRRHRQNGAVGTIATWEVEDPSAFGVIVSDASGRVLDFQEKPKLEEARSKVINAGAYVFEMDVFDYIGKGPVSLEREVFPRLLEMGLFTHPFQGYWVDCGTLPTYLKAQGTLIARSGGSVRACTGTAQLKGVNQLEEVILQGACIGPNVYACRAMVEEGACVTDSTLLPGSRVGHGAQVHNCLLGPGAVVAPGQVLDGSILVAPK